MIHSEGRVLVTGGAGFIGRHLISALIGRGYEVSVIDNSERSQELVRPGVTVHVGSILDKSLLDKASEGCACIHHLAAIPSISACIRDPLSTHAVNVLGTLTVLNCAQKCGARVILSSSAAIYSRGADGSMSPYGIQKMTCEEYLKSYSKLHGLTCVSLRYFNVYGPGQATNMTSNAVIPTLMSRLLRGETLSIYGTGSQVRDFVNVSDVIEANISAMSSRVPSLSNVDVGTGVGTSINKLVTILEAVTNRQAKVRHLPARSADISVSVAEIAGGLSLLNFRARVSVESGLKELANQFAN